jgi:hypothetical protein
MQVFLVGRHSFTAYLLLYERDWWWEQKNDIS